MNLIIIILYLTYKPANIMLNKKASNTQIKNSLTYFKNLNITNKYVKRNQIVITDSDDILFDAIAGSRTGTCNTNIFHKNTNKIHKNFNTFKYKLIKAQITTLTAQTIYITLQTTAAYTIYTIAIHYVQTMSERG